MRTLGVVGLVAVLAGTAGAENMTVGGSATIWIPQGDVEDSTGTSIGIRPHFAYRLRPFFAIVSSIDFVFVNEDEGVDSITYYSIAAGARLIKERPGSWEPYGELLLGWHSVETDGFDDTNLGFRIGGGLTYPLGNLVANVGLGYSAVSFDAGFFDIDVDAFVFELGLGARL